MSRSRKHVTLGLDGDVQPPGPGQAIVRALGSRGSNVIEVEFPDGRQTLVLMPAKFNKKLWVKRGGFVMVEDSAQAEGDTKVTGTIVSVLYDDQIKQLQKMEGVWPKEFAKDGKGSLEDMMPPSDSEESDQEEGQAGPSAAAVAGAAKAVAAPHGGDHGEEEGEEEEDDDGLPPLQQNTNRKVVYHEVSESDDDDDDD